MWYSLATGTCIIGAALMPPPAAMATDVRLYYDGQPLLKSIAVLTGFCGKIVLLILQTIEASRTTWRVCRKTNMDSKAPPMRRHPLSTTPAGLQVSQGVRVLSDMVEAGIKPRENHYAFLLREATSRGAFEEAFSQVREMVDGGVRPRLRTYSPLLKGLCHKVGCGWCWPLWPLFVFSYDVKAPTAVQEHVCVCMCFFALTALAD